MMTGAALLLDFNGNVLTQAPNPYAAPRTSASVPRQKSSTACPVCDAPLNRIRLMLPATRCRYCGRRVRLRSSFKSGLLSTVSAAACFTSAVFFEATPGNNSAVFAVHAAVLLMLGSAWFHLFGKPTLASWFGSASTTKLRQERESYRAESSNKGSGTRESRSKTPQ